MSSFHRFGQKLMTLWQVNKSHSFWYGILREKKLWKKKSSYCESQCNIWEYLSFVISAAKSCPITLYSIKSHPIESNAITPHPIIAHCNTWNCNYEYLQCTGRWICPCVHIKCMSISGHFYTNLCTVEENRSHVL